MKRTAIALILVLLVATTAHSQKQRPKIGLVLEGGGALGLAHIGVIEWLEKNRIPVDYVAGTSMGGLVGGLYASGKTPDEMRKIIGEMDWAKVLSGGIPFRSLSYRRKEDRIAYPNHLELGLKGGLSLPGGLNPGHEIGMVLSRNVIAYPDLKSFDELPIPFRCVASDLVTAKPKVFDSGSLSEALRATMSLPALFSPVSGKEEVYADGGLLNNLPVDVVKAMGADIVIAVYLDTGYADPKTLKTLTGVLGRSLSVMVSANEVESIKKADILISADLKGYTATDYMKGKDIADKGFEAAEKKAGMLRRFAVEEPEYKLFADGCKKKIRQPAKTIDFVEISGTSGPVLESVKKDLESMVGQPLEASVVEKEFTEVLGHRRFSRLSYSVLERDGKTGLAVRATELPSSPPFLIPAIEINGADPGDLRFGLGFRAAIVDFGGYRSELRLDGSVGTRNSVFAEYFRPIRPTSRVFFAPYGGASSALFPLYVNREQIADYRIKNNNFGLDAGMQFNRFAELRVGQSMEWVGLNRRIGPPNLPDLSGRLTSTNVKFNYEGTDDPAVPRSGVQFRTQFRYLYDLETSTSGPQLDGSVMAFQPISRKGSVFGGVRGSTIFGDSGLRLLPVSYGGPFRLGSYGLNELLGNKGFLATTGYLREIKNLNPPLAEKLYFVAMGQLAQVYGITPRRELPMDLSGMFVVKTVIGPAYFGGSWGNAGRFGWYFGIGRLF
jgi:NTE family protein